MPIMYPEKFKLKNLKINSYLLFMPLSFVDVCYNKLADWYKFGTVSGVN